MEAPKGRYSVVEKDGRLIVIDNRTGAPAVSNTPSPEPGRPGASAAPARPGRAPTPPRPSAARAPGAVPRPPASMAPIVPGTGMLDGIGAFLVTIASKGYDGDGNAIIGWEWKSNNKTRRWDARLDSAQQRRFGRALLAMSVAPLPILAMLLLDQSGLYAGMVLGIPLFGWGFHVISRLQKETGGLSG